MKIPVSGRGLSLRPQTGTVPEVAADRLFHQEREAVDVFQCDARSARDGTQRIFGDMERQSRLLRKTA